MAEKKPETELDTKKADAAKDEKAEKKPSKPARTVPLVATIVAAVVCLVLGGVVGHFCFNGTSSLGSQTLQEADLDTVVARYTYNGQTYEITAKNVITQSSSLDSAANDDGSYTVPTADNIIDLAQIGRAHV